MDTGRHERLVHLDFLGSGPGLGTGASPFLTLTSCTVCCTDGLAGGARSHGDIYLESWINEKWGLRDKVMKGTWGPGTPRPHVPGKQCLVCLGLLEPGSLTLSMSR